MQRLQFHPRFWADLSSADAKPTEAERRVWEEVNGVLTEAVIVLQDLQSYSGAGEAIRQASTSRVHCRSFWHQPVLCVAFHDTNSFYFCCQQCHLQLCLSVRVLSPQAIQHPSDERVQEGAWAAVVPLVGKLKKFYEFSLKLGMSFYFFLFSLMCTAHKTIYNNTYSYFYLEAQVINERSFLMCHNSSQVYGPLTHLPCTVEFASALECFDFQWDLIHQYDQPCTSAHVSSRH